MGSDVSVGGLVGASVSVGKDVDVSDGLAEAVSVGGGVDVSAAGTLVNVSTGAGDAEAGTCPVAFKLQAAVINVKITGRISFVFFMA